MIKYLRGLHASWVLLFTYAAFFVLLVISRNHQFWNQRKASSLLVQMVPKANERQTVFTDLYKAELEEKITILRLSYSKDDNNNNNVKEIIAGVKKDDSLLNASEKYISTISEVALFKKLQEVTAIKN